MMTAFIDNEVRKRTGSTEFFIQFLRNNNHIVDIFYDQSWIEPVKKKKYNLIIFFQDYPDLRVINLLEDQNVVIVPMWDACRTMRDAQWWELRKFKFLSFSRTLDLRLEKLGLNFAKVTYFPILENTPRQQQESDKVTFFTGIERTIYR